MRKPLVLSETQIENYVREGYVTVEGLLDAEGVIEGVRAYERVMEMQAATLGISESDYFQTVSQVRDLWKYDAYFESLILRSEIPALAAQLMGRQAARLLHDHVISKPREHSKEVPWHQDYPYWPVDHPGGLSVWLALDDVDEYSGALEVIRCSNHDGEEMPVDFLRDTKASLNHHPERKVIAVRKGDAVILNALTWHRTGPNTHAPQRRAYISLWVPPESRYAPLHADWHPVNLHVSVAAGALLNEDWFPVVGIREEQSWQNSEPIALTFQGPQVEDDDLSMFNASRLIRRKLQDWTGGALGENIYQALLVEDVRNQLLQNLKERGIFQGRHEDGLECLKILAINAVAFARFGARNVYNEAYSQFVKMFNA